MLLLGAFVLPFQRGGFQPDDQLRAVAVACGVLLVLAIAAPWPLIRSRSGIVAAAGLAGYAIWTGISIDWARIRIPAANDTARVALYAIVFTAALIAMRSPQVRRATPWALLVAIASASVYGLGTRLLPDVFEAEVFGNAGARLAHPVTYWNGLGMLAGAGVLIGVACAAERRAPRILRALACGLAVPCGLACYLTLSRGAFVAVIAGLLVLGLARPRVGTAIAALCALVPIGALALAVQALAEVKAAPVFPRSPQTSQGEEMAALVAGASLVAAVACFALARIGDRAPGWRPSFRVASVAAVAVTGLALAAAVGISYASEQSEEVATSASRLSEAKTFRGPYWDVALDSFADHPLAGVGSGSFRVEWRRQNVVPRGAFDAHSLYFETLGELGIVGAVLLGLFLGGVGFGVVRNARGSPHDPVMPAAVAVLAAYAVHLGVDWDWELPGVMMPALLLAAAALTRPEPAADRPMAHLDSPA